MKEAKKLKEENMELCKRLEQAEELCKRLGRAEQEAVRQQSATEQPTQVVATVSQVVSEAALPDMEQDGPQVVQDKGKPSDDQVVAQLQESAGIDGLSVKPVAGADSIAEASSSLNNVSATATAKTVDAKGLKSIEARLEHRLDKLEANIIEKLAKRLDMTICKSMLKMKDQQLLRGRGF